MKVFYPRGQKIERVQRTERNTPTLQPEIEYCLPGSRFARLMQLARAGASDRLIKRKIPGIDTLTIEVARKIVSGESAHIRNPKSVQAEQREREIFRLLDAGMPIKAIALTMGLCECSIYIYRRRWKARREAESAAG